MKRTLNFIFIAIIFSLILGCSNSGDVKTKANSEDFKKTFNVGEEEIVLKEKELLSNKIVMLLPESFEVMSEELAKTKYPNENRPTVIYTNGDGSVNVALNHTTSKIKDSQIKEFKDSIKQQFKNLYPSATWLNEEVTKTVDGKNAGVLELITPAIDTKIYNVMYFLELDNRLLLITFNSAEEKMDDWKPIAKEMMGSIVTSE